MDVIIDEKSKLPNYQKRCFEYIYIWKEKTGRKRRKMLTEWDFPIFQTSYF